MLKSIRAQNYLSLTSSQHLSFQNLTSTLTKTQFTSPFWPGSELSIFRQPPSSDVEAAWDRISNVRDIPLTSSDVLNLGKDPQLTVKTDSSWGFPPDTSLGLIHSFHELQCLNALRKGIYYNYYYYCHLRNFTVNPPDNYRVKYYTHMDHRIEFLRESIMCRGDVSVGTYVWMEGEKVPEADFRGWHQCRDFEGLVEWFESNEINANLTLEEEERWKDFGPKEGETIIPKWRR